jgi:hypothetical protein
VKPRFQADADLDEDIVTGLLRRETYIDFQTAEAAGLRGRVDSEVLLLAAREGRLLVSHDRKTMPLHFAQFISDNTSPGVLIVPQRLSIRSAIEELLMVWAASEAEEWVNRICILPL